MTLPIGEEIPPKLMLIELQVPTNVATTLGQQEELIAEPKQGIEIPETWVVDLIQPMRESDILLISENQDSSLLGEEKI